MLAWFADEMVSILRVQYICLYALLLRIIAIVNIAPIVNTIIIITFLDLSYLLVMLSWLGLYVNVGNG
jgi:hypothetical protein